jgi:hypothetical protein
MPRKNSKLRQFLGPHGTAFLELGADAVQRLLPQAQATGLDPLS